MSDETRLEHLLALADRPATEGEGAAALNAIGEHLLKADREGIVRELGRRKLEEWRHQRAMARYWEQEAAREAARAAEQQAAAARRAAEQAKRAEITTAKPRPIGKEWGAVAARPVKIGETVLIRSKSGKEWFGDVTELLNPTTFKYNNKRSKL